MLHGDLIVYWMSRLASYHPHLSTSAEPNLLNAFDLYGMHCCDVWMSVGAFVWVMERGVKGFIRIRRPKLDGRIPQPSSLLCGDRSYAP